MNNLTLIGKVLYKIKAVKIVDGEARLRLLHPAGFIVLAVFIVALPIILMFVDATIVDAIETIVDETCLW